MTNLEKAVGEKACIEVFSLSNIDAGVHSVFNF